MALNVAVISPTCEMVSLGHDRNYHLLLAHLASDPEYVKAARALKGYKILDNSLIEHGHEAFSLDKLLEAAELLGPDEIVLPDVFRDGAATVESTKAALDKMGKYRTVYKVAAVAHGTQPHEWLRCYKELVALGVDVIHIPKVMDELWPYGGRLGLVQWLDYAHAHRAPFVEYHLLGIWTNPIELVSYSRIPWLRGVDTALPIQAAMQGVVFNARWGLDPGTTKPKRPDKYFNTMLTRQQRMFADENVRILDNLARGVIQ